MSNYTKTTDFEAKDSLPTGDSGKIIRGAEFETEFDAISTAIATKADTAGPTFTGTLTFETISDGTIGVTAFVDEDDMSSDSATLVPTQQSVKAYVDSQVTAQDLDFQADTGGALSIDLDSETLTFTGGTGIDTSGSGNAVTFAIDSTVATLTGTQTLTNKTLTSPVLNTSVSGTAVLDEDDMSSNSATQLATQQSIKAYVDSQVGANNELSEILANGNTTGGTNIVFGDSASVSDDRLVFGDGSDLQIYHSGTHSYIDDAGTGNLTLRGNASVRVEKYEGEILADFAADGAVSLYHDNSVKIATTSTGVSVTGNVAVSGTVDGRDVATDGTKLDTVETNADVTDTANVTAAGALMDSELTSEASVKALNQGVATTDSPTFAGVTVNGTVEFDGLSGTGAVNVTDILDQDDMSSNSATALATQQSIKAYVDSQVATVDTLAEVLGNGNTTGGTDIAVGTGDDITFADSSKAIFGASSDLQIQHTGTDSRIVDSGTGTFYIAGTDLVLLDGTLAERYADFTFGGAAQLYHNNSAKLATTSTGIDVTGTVTADGLTVDGEGTFTKNQTADTAVEVSNLGTAGATTTSSFIVSEVAGTPKGWFRRYRDGTATTAVGFSDKLVFEGAIGSTPTNRMEIASNGDISFYEDTGTTAKLFWDASAESLGIGTSSPQELLHLSATTPVFRLEGGSRSYQQFVSGTDFVIRDVTATANRITLNSSGNVGIGTSSPSNLLTISDATTAKLELNRNGTIGNGWIVSTDNAANEEVAIQMYNSEFRLYNNSTQNFTVTSGGNVGIGTTSPGALLQVGVPLSSTAGIRVSGSHLNVDAGYQSSNVFGTASAPSLIFGGDANTGLWHPASDTLAVSTAGVERMRIESDGNLRVYDVIDNITNTLTLNGRNTGQIHFQSGGTEKMRMDASGNLLVGKTSTSFTVAGTQLGFDGSIVATRDANPIITLNRLSSDGEIQRFYKDGTQVGSIASNNGNRLAIGSSDTGLLFVQDADDIIPYSMSGGIGRDAAIDLGQSGNRFKDLYLSGSVIADGSILSTTGTAAAAAIRPNDDINCGIFFPAANTFAVTTDGSEAYRVDPFGNLLVGTTDTTLYNNTSGDGIKLSNSGEIQVANTNDVPLWLNRMGTDGAIVNLRKDGSTVGSIATVNSNMYLGTDDTGLYFNAGDDTVMPINVSTASGRDAGIDLGKSDTRFKDLYLSGGVYLGGTGSANHLDDFEEGDHTTSITCTTSGTVTLNTTFDSISYVKVGRLVTVTGLVIVGSVSSPVGAFSISMPFSAASSGVAKRGSDSAAAITVHNGVSANSADYVSTLGVGSSALTVYLGDNPDVQTDSAQQLQAGTEIYFHISYPTN